MSQTVDAFAASSKPGKQRTDASNELKSALEGILTAVNSELKTLANDNDEDEEEEEEADVVTQKKDAKQDSSVQKESENKEPDVSGGRLAVCPEFLFCIV